MTSVRDRLRAATQAQHQRLHHHPLLAPLTGEALTLADYIAALTGFHALHRATDLRLLRWWPERPQRAPLVAEDLALLGVATAGLPALDTLPPLTLPAERLGCRYVVEGSYIGGRALLPGVERQLGLSDGNGASFLAGSRFDAPGEWKALTRTLEHDLVLPDACAAAERAAVATFAAFERWLDGMQAGRGGTRG